jgi:hypothetical protein
MLADRQRNIPARRGRQGNLDARAIGQAGCQQGMLAADPLRAGGGDLPGKAIKHLSGQPGRVAALHRAADRLDPQLARPVDEDVGDIVPGQIGGKRCQIAVEVDVPGQRIHGTTSVKSRSRATNTATLLPCLIVSVGLISDCGLIFSCPPSGTPRITVSPTASRVAS